MRSKENVEVSRGLRQGCPLSPLLFMLYMVSMEKALEGSNIGFNLSHKQGGMMIEQKLPGLFYADDIVLFADSRDDIQQLANICGREGEALGLGFSVTKCGLMVFNDPCDQTVSIQGQEIPRNLVDLWIHADVLSGSAGKPPVEANLFMRQSLPFHPFAIISLGWNTKPKGAYSWGQVESMARLASCGYPFLSRVAFKVRASMVEASLAQLSWLFDVMPNATLVVWYADGEAPHPNMTHALRMARLSAHVVHDLPQDHRLENIMEEAVPEMDSEIAMHESAAIGWSVEANNTGSCRKASLPGRNAVVLGDNGVSMMLPDSWSNFEAKLDLTKPRSLAVSIGGEKLALEGSCFQLVLNRSGQEVTSRAWPTTCKYHGPSSSPSKKPTAPAMVKQWTYGEPAPLKLQPSPGAVVYAVRLQDPPDDSTAAASSLVPTLILLFFGVLAVKVPAL
ncbi:uncharacterized protein LOC119174205 isoform X1 [Rhipicephalus microplus]|uniref:uncharacterized protein LOC119174205 isoform X1 n=1 Tax=Rhipicephalus microplus TaxID=6941 RepID=UPI003F6B7943